MFTTNVIGVESLPDGRKKIEVQFTDGSVITPSEFVIPQDVNGFQFYIKGRLDALNFAPPSTGAYTLPVTTVTPPTQADIDFANFNKWLQLTIAINAAKQLGWITGNEQMVQDAKAKVLSLASVNLPKLFS